eukprot:TRINITY_DN4736_c0_g1_i2.p4 TRINITY_DN4736_c0_g1~~TRINITY_DN4736_c0_g1_i2.p4  ORF type:complete len:117 (-),score=4.60 TRINITY_DN4736_c0_g1_i2:507-857(-)
MQCLIVRILKIDYISNQYIFLVLLEQQQIYQLEQQFKQIYVPKFDYWNNNEFISCSSNYSFYKLYGTFSTFLGSVFCSLEIPSIFFLKFQISGSAQFFDLNGVFLNEIVVVRIFQC